MNNMGLTQKWFISLWANVVPGEGGPPLPRFLSKGVQVKYAEDIVQSMDFKNSSNKKKKYCFTVHCIKEKKKEKNKRYFPSPNTLRNVSLPKPSPLLLNHTKLRLIFDFCQKHIYSSTSALCL